MLNVDISVNQGDFNLDVAFAAGPGITVIAGPSGAGKTTLASALVGLTRPDRGTITINDRLLFDDNTHLTPADRRVGYVLQDSLLFPHLTVERNLRYGLRYGAIAFDTVTEILEIAHLLDRKPQGLSGGEQQRVSIGRALLSQPDFLVMDEPLSSLDRQKRDRLMTYLEALRTEQDLTMVYVSHNWPEIIRLADTLVLMDKGKVLASGTPAELLANSRAGDLVPDGAIIEAKVAADLESAGGPLFVPSVSTEIGKPARIFIDARDVALALEQPTGLSIQNILAGTISAIIPRDASHVDVSLDLGDGQMIRAQITTRAREALTLETGMPVFALIKSVALDRDLPWVDLS
jgi:molybdate transport system ATP-binding protein